MYRFSSSFLLLGAIAAPAFSASPDPRSLAIPETELSEARALVQKLGSPEFEVREEAEAALARMGRSARPALLEGVRNDPDPEVRARCSTLLPLATALEMKARLEVFLADTEGKYEHDFPGWNEFRATVCNEWRLLGHVIDSDRSLEKPARAAFAAMISSHANRFIVTAAGGSRDNLRQVVSTRRQELYYQRFPRAGAFGPGMAANTDRIRQESTPDDIATLLFAESLLPSEGVVGRRSFSMSLLLSSSGFSNVVREASEKGQVYRAIAIAWLETRNHPQEMMQATTIATSLNLPEQAIRLSARLLSTQDAIAPYRASAATTLARLGSKEHLPLLQKTLEDENILVSIRVSMPDKPASEWKTYDIQVRDVGLAVSLQLVGLNPEDFGFKDQYQRLQTAGVGRVGFGGSYTRYYIPDENRKAAFEKWKNWLADHPAK
jgi:hypothetical protein